MSIIYSNLLNSGLSGCNGLNNLDSNPNFNDPSGGNFSLSNNSIALNIGSNNHIDWANLDVDLNRIPRIIDGTVDLGAYEYCDENIDDCEMLFSSNSNFTIHQQELTLFPNPVNDILNIMFEIPTSQEGIIELISLSGQILKQKDFEKRITNSTFDVSDIQAGYYLLRIKSGKFQKNQSILIY